MTLDQRLTDARGALHRDVAPSAARRGEIAERVTARRRRRATGVLALIALAVLGSVRWMRDPIDRTSTSPGPTPAATPTVLYEGLRAAVPADWSILTSGCPGAARTVFVGTTSDACGEPDATAAWVWLRPVGELATLTRECGPGYFGASVAERAAGATNRVAFCQARVASGSPRSEVRFIDGLDRALVINHGGGVRSDALGLQALLSEETMTFDEHFEIPQARTAADTFMNAWLAADCDRMRPLVDRQADLCPTTATERSVVTLAATSALGSVPRTTFRATLTDGQAYDLGLQYVFSVTDLRGSWLVASIAPAG